jgi:hypothetical protein
MGEYFMKKRSYPGSVRVGESLYEVALVPHLLDGNKIDANSRGFCERTPDGIKRILIDRTMSEELIFETFVHEAPHALEYEYDLNIKHKLIHKLEAPLAKFLKDNFHLRWRKPV